jgi:lipopolysaccharide export system protein LptC
MAPATEPALRLAGAATAPGGAPMTLHWTTRLSDLVSAYLPLLLMGLLALGTWWLVENSPMPLGEATPRPLRHEPDYTMTQFSVQRFAADGRLRVQIEGQALRHYPDTDTIEIDLPRIRAYAPDGRETVATARLAISNGDGSEVQLQGDAQVRRAADAREPAIEFRSEFLHAFFDTEVLRSHRPVVVRRGAAELRADRLEYRQLEQRVELGGRIHASFPPAAGAAR